MAPKRYGADAFLSRASGVENEKETALLGEYPRDDRDVENPTAEVLEEEGNNRSLCVAVCALMAAVPALIGS